MNPNPFPLVLYLVAVIWAIVESKKRWTTLLWIVLSFAVVVSLAGLLAWMRPSLAPAFSDLAVVLAPLISAVVGWNYMRAHRRSPVPKP
jgi:cytochrome c biogenesis protein CcdA